MELLETLSGHNDRVWSLSWSPSTPLLASCSTDKSLRFYSFSPFAVSPSSSASKDVEPARKRPRFTHHSTIPGAHTRTIRSLSFSPTGTTLATASFDSTVGIWQPVNAAGIDDDDGGADAATTATGQEEWESSEVLEGHETEVKSVAWSADGRLIATCGRDKSVWVWEQTGPAAFECLAVLMEHSQDVKSVAFHPKEELLASASYDDTVKLYVADAIDDEWACAFTLSEHTATVWALAWSPGGEHLATAGDDLVIKIWSRSRQGTKTAEEVGGIAGEAKREEGGRMGPWSAEGVRIGEGEKWKWKVVHEIKDAHERTIYSLDWTVGSKGTLGRLASAGGDGTINVFELSAVSPASTDLSHTLLTSVESAHGVSDINSLRWCRLQPSLASAALQALEGGEDDEEPSEAEKRAMDERWDGCEDLLASAGDDGEVKVWLVPKEVEAA